MADLNGDGQIDFDDFFVFIDRLEKKCAAERLDLEFDHKNQNKKSRRL